MNPAGQRSGSLYAVHPGHVDVEKDDIGLQALHEGYCLAAIGGLAHNQEFGPSFLQSFDDLFTHQAFIVGNDGGGSCQGAHAGTSNRAGVGTIS